MLRKTLFFIGAIFVFSVIFGGVLTPLATPFYYRCREIEKGMSEEAVLKIMDEYTKKDDYIFNNQPLLAQEKKHLPSIDANQRISFFTESLFDDFQCNIYLKDSSVVYVEKIFD